MNKKLRLVGALALSMSLFTSVLTGCSSKPSATTPKGEDKKVTLEFWTISLKPKFDPYFQTIFDNYKKDHPNVTINWTDLPYDALQSKLLSSIASGNAPDVVNLNTETALQMAGKDALLNLDKEITADQKAVYFGGLYKAASDKNGVYALPWYTGAPVLFMNKDLIAKAGLDVNNPPKTQEEMMAWGKQIKEKTGKYGYTMGSDASAFVGEGIPLLSDDKKTASFNTAEAVAFLTKNADLFKTGVVPKEKMNFDKEVQYFAGGNSAMMTSGTTLLNRLKTTGPNVYANTVVAPAPTGKAKVTFAGTMNMAVPKATKNKKEAIDFALFVTNAQNQLEFSKAANTLPSTKDSLKDEFFKKDDGTVEAKAKLQALKTLETVTDFSIGVKNATDIRTGINKAFENVYLNGGDPAKELKSAENSVNELLKKID